MIRPLGCFFKGNNAGLTRNSRNHGVFYTFLPSSLEVVSVMFSEMAYWFRHKRADQTPRDPLGNTRSPGRSIHHFLQKQKLLDHPSILEAPGDLPTWRIYLNGIKGKYVHPFWRSDFSLLFNWFVLLRGSVDVGSCFTSQFECGKRSVFQLLVVAVAPPHETVANSMAQGEQHLK